jgi:hypothetical protein
MLNELTEFLYAMYIHIHLNIHSRVIIFVADFSVKIHVRRFRMNLDYTTNILQRLTQPELRQD